MATYPLRWQSQVAALVWIGSLGVGCSAPWTQKTPESELEKRSKAVQDLMSSEERPVLVGEAAKILWNDSREYEGYGVVNGLLDTGGDVKPSGQRDYILDEMRRDGVDSPNQVLKLKTTALGAVTVKVGPEHSKGDKLDAIVDLSSECEATSLLNGWLMPCQIREMAALGGSVKRSEMKAKASGPVVLLPKSLTNNGSLQTSGIVLGGTHLYEERRLALRIDESIKHVSTAASISRAINDHYWFYDGADRRGVATAKNDAWIFLDIPSRFRWDVKHYVDAISAIGFSEDSSAKSERLASCRRQLKEPLAARSACLQLESLGQEAVPILEEGMRVPDDESRFFAAYSLAYLNHAAAVPILVELIKKDPKFIPAGLVGLQILDHYSAKDALIGLLEDEDPKLRYGALWTLRRRDPTDSAVQGTPVNALAHVISLPSAHPLIAVSLEERAEVAFFGGNPQMKISGYFEINPRLTIRPQEDGRLRIVRFQPKGENVTAVITPDTMSVVHALDEVGASYSDLVALLDEAARQKWIDVPVAMNPRPDNIHSPFYILSNKQKDSAKAKELASIDSIPEEQSDALESTSSDTKKTWWLW